MRLNGKVAVVTGSGQGIGLGIAQRLAREGAAVVINDLDDARLGEGEQTIRAIGGRVLPVRADVSRADDVERLFEETRRAFGGVDVLVNNAAWASPIAHFLDMTEEFLDKVLAINLKSMFFCSQRAARIMAEQRKPGSIVNISTYGAARAQREMSAYNAAKGGLEAATRTIALDLAPWGIRVNAVGPGPIATPSFLELFNTPEKLDRMRLAVPLERLGKPEDIAAAVAFFASDDAAFVTGQVLYVDGGSTAQIRPSAYTTNLKRPSPQARS
ncbi:MAG TPA: SDR family oxidoreductase [Pirellulales bacterium]|jgi:3-oxoacyl-[acyl-carrier protein] reductase|nr:SDR family oxidoreductase [Pirellulales bacterium]